MYFYWRAVFSKHQPNANFQPNVERINADYERFLELASPEGRKVCEAHFSIASNELLTRACDNDMDAWCAKAERAIASEKYMLPFLLRGTQRQSQSPAKENVMLTYTVERGNVAAKEFPLPERLQTMAKTALSNQLQCGAYGEAVKLCLMQLTIDGGGSSRHLWLSNRSLAYYKMGDFAAAAEDARKVVGLKPGWAKGHLRLAAALAAACDGRGVLEAAEAGLVIAPHNRDLARLRSRAGCLTNTRRRFKCKANVRKTEAWERVRFKESILHVSTTGNGDFTCIQEAVEHARSLDHPSTIFLQSGQTYCLTSPVLVSGKSGLQVLGEKPNVKVCFLGDANSTQLILVHGDGTSFWCENVSFQNTTAASGLAKECMTFHCILAQDGSSVFAHKCDFLACDACIAASSARTCVTVTHSVVRAGSGAGLIASTGAVVAAAHCQIKRTHAAAAEAREGGLVRLRHCEISDVSRQAVMIYQGGAELLLEDTTITRCGKPASYSAVLIECGKVALRRCDIHNNRGDGIVVQRNSSWGQSAEEGDDTNLAQLDLSGCHIHHNVGRGLLVRHVHEALFVDNIIVANAGTGVQFCPPAIGHVQLARNEIRDHTTLDVLVPLGSRVDFHLNRSDKCWEVGSGGKHFQLVCPRTGKRYNPGQGYQPFLQYLRGKSLQAQNEPFCDHKERFMSAQHFNLKALVASCEALFREYRKSQFRETMDQQSDLGSAHRSATMHSTAPLSKLRPCRIQNLVDSLGHRAEGRVLFGTLATDVVKIISVNTTLGDDHGDGIHLAIYNMPGCSSWWGGLGKFPNGLRVGIKEPVMKQRADATLGVRVDHPEDVVIQCTSPCCTATEVFASDASEMWHLFPACKLTYCSLACRKVGFPLHKVNCNPLESLGVLRMAKEATPQVAVCAMCTAKDPNLKCARCGSERYCGRVCQKRHWRHHKLTCPARPSSSTSATDNSSTVREKTAAGQC
jgi:hypothetical protein